MNWQLIDTADRPENPVKFPDVLLFDPPSDPPVFVAHWTRDGWRNSHSADGEPVPEPVDPTHWAPIIKPASSDG